MSVVLALVALAASLGVVTPSAESAAPRVAVIVGNNTAGDDKGVLKYAERDAERVADLLRSLGGVDEVHVLLGKRADELRRALAGAAEGARRGAGPSTFFFFYSGHADEEALLMGGSRFGFGELREQLSKLPARVTIAFVDACQSGRLARTKGGKVVPVVNVRFEDNESYRGRVFVTSSAVGEVSQEADELEASYFTHYLLSALRGAADLSGDGRVSLEEAYHYVYRQTVARTSGTFSGPQHPTYDVDVTGQGELVLTHLTPGHSYVVLPKAAAGRYYVRAEPSGAWLAEVNKLPGQAVRVALAPGAYRVSRAADDHLLEKRVTLAARQELVLDETGMMRRPLTFAVAKGAGVEQQLSLSYAVRSGYLEDASSVHAGSLAYMRRRGRVQWGGTLEYGWDGYRRRDGAQVRLDELGALAHLGTSMPLGELMRVVGAVESGPVWVRQNGKFDGAPEQELSSMVLSYRAVVGLDVLFGDYVFGLRSTGGQLLMKKADGVHLPLVASLVLGVGARL